MIALAVVAGSVVDHSMVDTDLCSLGLELVAQKAQENRIFARRAEAEDVVGFVAERMIAEVDVHQLMVVLEEDSPQVEFVDTGAAVVAFEVLAEDTFGGSIFDGLETAVGIEDVP